MRASLVSLLVAAVLAGCSPGIVLHLYNATGDTLRITNPPFRRVVTIPPDAAKDIACNSDMLIQSSHHSWMYSADSAFVPKELFQQHTMLWRAFGEIDNHGRIYVFAPPQNGESPRKIPQPVGFPWQPKT